LIAGPSYHDAIEEALDSARCIVVLWSAVSVQSQWVKTEANEGLEREILVPMLIDDVKLQLAFRMSHTVRMLAWPEDKSELNNVVDGVRNLIGSPGASSVSPQSAQSPPHNDRSLAVLPFEVLSTNQTTGFFAAGLAEDVLDILAKAEGLYVASRSAGFALSRHSLEPSVIGDKLGVAYFLEGSVRQMGDDLRINVQLIRARDGVQVWSKSYDRTLDDGFEMQTAVAINIAYIAESKLSLDLMTRRAVDEEGLKDKDPAAVDQFIRAREEYRNFLLGEGGSWEAYVQYLVNAIDADRSFHAAYRLLGNAYLQRHYRGRISLADASPIAHTALDQAREMKQVEARSGSVAGVDLLSIQISLSMDLDYASAQASLTRILKQDPKSGWIHQHLAMIDLRENRPRQALRQMANATDMTVPETPLFLAFVAWIRCVCGDYEDALRASSRGLKLAVGDRDRVFILRMHAMSLIMQGKVDEARPFIDEGWRQEQRDSPENYIGLFALVGDTDRARAILSDQRFDLIDHYHIAFGHLALGDIDNAFVSIEAGVEDHNSRLFESLNCAQWWAPIRADTRYMAVFERIEAKVQHTKQYLERI
jgi:TolB-like protein